MDKRNVSAWGLIIFGSVLLLMQLDIITPSRSAVVILFSIFTGIMLFYKGLSHAENKGILGGSFFLLFAFTLSLMKWNWLPSDDQFGISLIILDLAAANFIFYLFRRENMSNLIFGFILLAVGTVVLIDFYDVMPLWMLVDLMQTYWPVVLIIIGIIILSTTALNKRNRNAIT
jgi:hypothetical protein